MTQFFFKCWFVFLHAAFQVHAAVRLPNVECKPIPTTVALDDPLHRFNPYYVTLHRCQGSVQTTNPNIKKCVVTVSKELTVIAYSKEKGWIKVPMKNHTKCGSECQANPTDCHHPVQSWNQDKCKCVCLYQNSAPPEHVTQRKNGFRWNPYSCRYECSGSPTVCPAKKEWDRDSCSCVCSKFHKRRCDGIMDSNSCECQDQAVHGRRRPGFFSCVSALVLLVLLVVAVAVIILLSCLLCKAKRPTMMQAPSEASQITGSSNDTAGTILEARDIAGTIPEARYTTVTVLGSEETSGSTLYVSGV